MGRSPWGHRESDTTRQLTLIHSRVYMSLLMFFGKNTQLTLGETSFMKTGYILILLSLKKIDLKGTLPGDVLLRSFFACLCGQFFSQASGLLCPPAIRSILGP